MEGDLGQDEIPALGGGAYRLLRPNGEGLLVHGIFSERGSWLLSVCALKRGAAIPHWRIAIEPLTASDTETALTITAPDDVVVEPFLDFGSVDWLKTEGKGAS